MNDTIDRYPAYTADEDEISLVEIANVILRNWRLIVVLPLLIALVVGIWSLSGDRSYAASASFMSQGGEGRGTGGAAALAQQFGLSLGADRPGESPQFYVDLLKSRTVLRQAAESVYEIPTDAGRVWRGTLVEYWEFDQDLGPVPPWRRATESLEKNISASVGRETGVIRLTVSTDHPVLSERIAERLLVLLNEYNLEVRQTRAQEEGRFIGGRITEAQAELLAAEGALQEFLQQNREFGNSPELVFEHERLQRRVMMRQEVYTSLLRSQEQARIDAVRDVPLFTVIDHPAGTAEPEGRGTIMRAMLAFILGLMLAVIAAFVLEFARRSRESEDPQLREFQGLTRQAWHDLRHPRQWLRQREEEAPASDR
ncbi:MAG: GNVR domain-containing protein [Gemmatimonadota bacterium]